MARKIGAGGTTEVKQVWPQVAASAAVPPPPTPVQEHPAPTHIFDELDTRATLADKLGRTMYRYHEGIRCEVDAWALIEFGNDGVAIVAIVAAAMGGDAGGVKQLKHVAQMVLNQKNPGVCLWLGMIFVNIFQARDKYRSKLELTPAYLHTDKVRDMLIEHLIASAQRVDRRLRGRLSTSWV